MSAYASSGGNNSFDPNNLASYSVSGTFGVSTMTTTSQKKPKFKIGDLVIGKPNAPYCVTKEGWKGRIVNLFDHMLVVLEDGDATSYSVDAQFFDLVKPLQEDAPKKESFELSKLEPLVISAEVLEEIKAVLKQHKHSDILFKKWGLADVIEYGRGMTFLFYGPPGTGKTWAATCISRVFGRELMTITAAEIQSSEPGGANRNIQMAFASAKEQNKVLFLDECDSLIANRSDMGMIIGGEINTLLTEIERSEGIVILATNQVESLDAALERRIALIVEFPEPTYEQREAIWQRLLPKKMPLAADVSVKSLAEFKLTGGQIKNVVLQAARLAVASESKEVNLKHFTSAIQRTLKSKNLLGSASRYSQGRHREDFTRG